MFAAALGPIISVLGKIYSAGAWVVGLFGTGGALAGAVTWLSTALGGLGTALGGIGTAAAGLALPIVALVAAIATLIAVIVLLGPQAWEMYKQLNQLGMMLEVALLQKIISLAKSLGTWFSKILTGLGGFAKSFFAAGRNLMVGLINGAASVAWQLVQIVLKPIYHIIAEVRRVLGIRSPSSVFAEYGKQMMMGLAKGVGDFESKPVGVTVGAMRAVEGGLQSGRLTSPIQDVGSSSARRGTVVEVKQITINGDMSESQKKALKREMMRMFTDELGMALNG